MIIEVKYEVVKKEHFSINLSDNIKILNLIPG